MDVLAQCPGDSPVDPDAPKWTGWTPSNYPAIPVSLASVVSTAFTLACLRDRVLRPSYVVSSETCAVNAGRVPSAGSSGSGLASGERAANSAKVIGLKHLKSSWW